MSMKKSVVTAPASKSMSHRAVISAGLASGTSRLSGVLESQDLERTIEIMTRCGASIKWEAPGVYEVRGVSGRPRGGDEVPVSLDVGESGTTCRLITAVVAAGMGSFFIHGRGRMHDRPIKALTDALETQSVRVEWRGREGCPPLVLTTQGLAGGLIDISLEESSQYLSGLLLAAPMARESMAVEITGEKAVSWPYVALTLQTLEDFGLSFLVEEKTESSWTPADWRSVSNAVPGRIRFQVDPGHYRARELQVEGDWSNASYFLAAGAVGPTPVEVLGLRPDSLQGDRAMLDILSRMGGSVEWIEGEGGPAVRVSPARLKGIVVDMGSCPDIAPTVAVTAALAQGPTEIRNAAHLRIKESNRLEALVTEISKTGAKVELLEDGLRITPGPSPLGRTFSFSSYNDHRIAMCLSIFERAGAKVRLDNPACVAKSFPEYWGKWRSLF